MTVFKLFSRPYAIAFVDDDRDFLELLGMAMPKHWNAVYCSKTHSFIELCKQAALMESRDYALLCAAFHAEFNAEHGMLKVIRYWQNNPQRWNLCEIGVLDYGMPKMTGLQVLEALDAWHGKRVLLTGIADEHIAVQAFNQGLIDHYLPKQSERVIDRLVQAVDDFSPRLHPHFQQFIRSHLSDSQLGLLKPPSVTAALSAFAGEHWIEYMVLDSPFGILGLSATGQLSWLQLERSCDIDDLKAIAANEAWDEPTLQALARGEVLSNSLLRQALGNGIAPATAPIVHFGAADVVGALFEFELPNSLKSLTPVVSYRDWLLANSSPLVRD